MSIVGEPDDPLELLRAVGNVGEGHLVEDLPTRNEVGTSWTHYRLRLRRPIRQVVGGRDMLRDILAVGGESRFDVQPKHLEVGQI